MFVDEVRPPVAVREQPFTIGRGRPTGAIDMTSMRCAKHDTRKVPFPRRSNMVPRTLSGSRNSKEMEHETCEAINRWDESSA